MKRTLIALAVAGAAVATGVNAGELYNQDGTTLSLGGRAEARMSIKDGDVSDVSRVRVNVSGKQEISDDLYGVGFYEAQYTTNDLDANGNSNSESSSIEHRYAYAGLGGNFGEITYGKNDAALGVITDFTDIMDYHGAKASKKLESADRIDNLLSYKGDFNDLSVKAAYRFADRTISTDGNDYDDNDADAFSLSGIYTVADTGLAIGLGYADQNDLANQWMLTASYTWNDLYVSALYSAADLDDTDNDYDGFELAASYTMDKTVFYVTYNKGELDDGHVAFFDADDLAVEVAYFFKPNFRGYVSYDFNMLDDDEVGDAAAEDEAVLGLRYDF
ncbi:Porin-like protein L precursor [Vibrio aerogenes CECT 7868]|uniref:Porin-like protein L n=1 Tax=Vibrio aerogenes CECT 7868 TaxID=1216006 RepID=A0A1M5YBD6_9VIBR|nr:porin [Vibrio aerogenes]SHI09164.1 Porin-like protein L precursor [Vibrio aerogenes CECT 7868]